MLSDPSVQPGHGPAIITTSEGTGRLRVVGTAQATGDGVVITLTGGDHPHVGAVGVGIPRHSLRDPRTLSASSSVLTITGHKDDELAKPMAELIARRLGQVAVVAVGLHVDQATPEEIAIVSEHARQATMHLLSRLLAGGAGNP